MKLYLGKEHCTEKVALDFLAVRDEIREASKPLEQFGYSGDRVRIVGAEGPAQRLVGYISYAYLGYDTDRYKVNQLARKFDKMDENERNVFFAALDMEIACNVFDAVRVADDLDRYELLPNITTDEKMGQFLVDTAQPTGNFFFPEEARPYLDYARIGAEQRETLRGTYTPYGFIKYRDAAPVQAPVEQSTIRLTLTVSQDKHTLDLPVSEEQLERTKRALGLYSFAQAGIGAVHFSDPRLAELVPLYAVNVEEANVLALWLQQFGQENGELEKFCSVLEAEQPYNFSGALTIAMDIDDYELVPEYMDEYGKQVLRRAGATEELLGIIDGYMDFAQLGEDSVEQDGVRGTQFGSVRRISAPFLPQEPEQGQTMF